MLLRNFVLSFLCFSWYCHVCCKRLVIERDSYPTVLTLPHVNHLTRQKRFFTIFKLSVLYDSHEQGNDVTKILSRIQNGAITFPLFNKHMFHTEDLFVRQIQIYQSTNSNWSFCHVSPYQFF